MRRLLTSTVLALFLVVPSLAGAQEDTLGKIKRTGAITIGYTETSAPFSSVGPGGTPEGYSIDLCLHIAEGVKKDLSLAKLDVKWAKVTAENRIAHVVGGTVDIECGTTTKTLSRMQQVDFTALTFLDGGSLLVSTASGIKKITDLSGKRVCVAKGTTSLDRIQQISPPPIIVGVVTWADCLVALQQRQVDAVSTDDSILAGLVSQDPYLHIVGPSLNEEPYGIGVNLQNTGLVRFVNGTLERIRRDGTWYTLYRKWLTVLGPAPAPPVARYSD